MKIAMEMEMYLENFHYLGWSMGREGDSLKANPTLWSLDYRRKAQLMKLEMYLERFHFYT